MRPSPEHLARMKAQQEAKRERIAAKQTAQRAKRLSALEAQQARKKAEQARLLDVGITTYIDALGRERQIGK